jgi:hypothetical protein
MAKRSKKRAKPRAKRGKSTTRIVRTMTRTTTTLRGSPSDHAREYENHMANAEDTIRQGEKATACGDMYTAAIQVGSRMAVANHESSWAFQPNSFQRKEADARLEKALKRAIKLDDKFRAKCMFR